jgi:arylsulfatase
MIKIRYLFTLALAFVLALSLATAATAADKPNVVLMLADNVGWGDIGVYGGGEMRGMPTPRIDRLAREGLQFTQFLVEPGCTPSRAALMTGRYSTRVGLNTVIIGGTPNTLQASEVTLAELFKSQGYATAHAGKWHLGSEEQSWPTRQGFDEYHVGVIETSDGTLYRDSMERSGMPEAFIEKVVPRIYESDADGNLKAVSEYTVEYRHRVEGDIAKASVEFIQRQAKAKKPFFLYIGWTHSHYPSVVPPEFEGASRTGPYGDAIMELDYRTGQVLDAIEEAGIEDNTIVIWLSDNAATPISGPPEFRGGNNGPFRGELGDALEGSLRVPGMIKWPGKIAPGKSNEMVAIHDVFPTLATIIGADVPTDRPIDGVDQSAFLLGEQETSNREHLITFIENEVAAVRWHQWRIYPKEFTPSGGNPARPGLGAHRSEMTSMPAIYNIEYDPREEDNLIASKAWVFRPYMQVIGEYLKSLKQYPNPPGVSLTKFK